MSITKEERLPSVSFKCRHSSIVLQTILKNTDEMELFHLLVFFLFCDLRCRSQFITF
nr:MAG TPA: hypothetical protein [Caudoviricetes sp.]